MYRDFASLTDWSSELRILGKLYESTNRNGSFGGITSLDRKNAGRIE